MNSKKLLLAVVAAVFSLVSCEELTNLGTPEISISETELSFEVQGGTQTLTVSSTRDWKVENDSDWVAISPEKGDASDEEQTVTITVLENTGMDRTANLKFTIGMMSKYLTVSQSGPGGSAEQLVVYSNDFDITKAQNNSGWPYLDSNYDLWDNKKGTGADGVTYAFGGKMSVRTSGKLSNDGSGYSHYSGSGMNKIFFGTATSIFKIQNIALNADNDSYKLSFGGQRYTQDDEVNNFSFEEFKVYLSKDAEKWVPVTMEFPADSDINGDWNLATASITLPAGTDKLSIVFVCTKSSAYSIDDVLLEVGSQGGQTIDFTNGESIDGTSGGEVTPPSDIKNVTVAEFNSKEVSTTEWYRLTGKVGGPINTQYGNYDLEDATGTVYVYGTSNWAEYSSVFGEGGTVTIVGQRGQYGDKIEVLESYIESFTPGEGGSDSPSGAPSSLVTATIAEFLAAPESSDTWYKLTGEIISIAKEDYGNFTIKDATGEVYIYGMTNTWVGSNDKSFSKLGLKVGDTVTLGTLRGSYNGTPQGGGSKVPAYYISHVTGGSGETPDPGTPSGTQVATVAQFLAAEVSTSVLYQVTGTVSVIESSSAEYHNMTLTITDETGSLYIYRMKAEGKNVEELGITVGDELTLKGNRGDYNGNPQMINGIYVSHVDKEAPASEYDAVITFSEKGYENAESVDGVTIAIDSNISCVFNKAAASTAPAYYNSGAAIRMYQNGSTLTVSAANGKKIKKIEFTFGSNMYYMDADSGTLSAEAPTRTWEGDASSVKFTATGTTSKTRAYVAAIKVAYE